MNLCECQLDESKDSRENGQRRQDMRCQWQRDEFAWLGKICLMLLEVELGLHRIGWLIEYIMYELVFEDSYYFASDHEVIIGMQIYGLMLRITALWHERDGIPALFHAL